MSIAESVRRSRSKEVENLLSEYMNSLKSEGYDIEFGSIGNHTTYVLLTKRDSGEEIVGYTFIKNMKYYNENVGKLKALQQAIARKDSTRSHS